MRWRRESRGSLQRAEYRMPQQVQAGIIEPFGLSLKCLVGGSGEGEDGFFFLVAAHCPYSTPFCFDYFVEVWIIFGHHAVH